MMMCKKLLTSSLVVATFPYLGISLFNPPAIAQSSEYPQLACQREIVRRVAGPGSGDSFVRFRESVQETFVSNAERRVQGEGQQVTTYSDGRIVPSSFTYNCLVNVRDGRVPEANYSMRDTPAATQPTPQPTQPAASTSQQSISMCQEEIKNRVISDNRLNVGGLVNITVGAGRRVSFPEPAQTSTISNTEESVRGRALVRAGNSRQDINYNCTVNTREGRVTSATYQ
jgi:hypothetical protein